MSHNIILALILINFLPLVIPITKFLYSNSLYNLPLIGSENKFNRGIVHDLNYGIEGKRHIIIQWFLCWGRSVEGVVNVQRWLSHSTYENGMLTHMTIGSLNP